MIRFSSTIFSKRTADIFTGHVETIPGTDYFIGTGVYLP